MSKEYCCRCDDWNYTDSKGRCNQCGLKIKEVVELGKQKD